MRAFLFLAGVLARQIVIAPKSTLVFFESVKRDDIYKFIYNTRNDVHVSLTDPRNIDIMETTNRSATIYTKIAEDGRIKMSIQNQSDEKCIFSYKCPDPNKELTGHVGYVKDTDLVNELARVFDELIDGQTRLVKRTLEHQEMVAKSRFWAKMLMSLEFVMTAIVVYVIHKDFIGMFEKKQSL